MKHETKETIKGFVILLLLSGWIATEIIDQIQENAFFEDYHFHVTKTERYMSNISKVDAEATMRLAGMGAEIECDTVFLRGTRE